VTQKKLEEELPIALSISEEIWMDKNYDGKVHPPYRDLGFWWTVMSS